MSRQQHRVIISGGGTGGHIFPAIAIANALRRREPEIEILFIGALGRMEMEKIPRAGYEIKGLPIEGMQRKLTMKNLALPFKVISSLVKAKSMINQFHPDAVAGVGGYASGPVLFAATRMKIPALIQEQNSYAGITNKILGKRVNKICVAYEGMQKFFPVQKLILTGNPVRKEIAEAAGRSAEAEQSKRKEALRFFGLHEAKKVLLILGGSLGAATINESIGAGLKNLYESGISVIWQTGKGYFEKYEQAAKEYADRIKVLQFIDRMDLAYSAADVVVSRAGALSIAELCVVKKPAILVPSPNVAEDHQTKNALSLVDKQAALLVRDDEARAVLVSKALALLNDEASQQQLEQHIALLAKPHADDDIANEILKMIQ